MFLGEHADAAWRSCLEGHLTGSAVVVRADGSRALLMLHRKLGRWLQPGGHADGDTYLGGVALRDSFDESGLVSLRLAEPSIDVEVH